MDSTSFQVSSGNYFSVTLYGCLASPAANIKISGTDITTNGALIKANQSTYGKDSTITVHRVQ